ncbi:MAG TPA: DUF4384 domain-containing protein [Bryobacteraceae bacterium]|jgi:hypothetical protein
MKRRAWLVMIPLLSVAPLVRSDDGGKVYVQVTLERQEGSEWKAVDPRTILDQKDKIRFRFSTSFPGYLYVFDRASDGSTEKLYPNDETANNNRVEPGQSYLLPSASGNYLIDGPPGYDITHWIVTPEPLAALPTTSDMPRSEIPSTLIPRCREGGLKARGVGGCLDDHAGPQAPKDSALKARNIKIEKSADAKITSPSAKMAPIVYEFRVAHQ